MSVLKRLLRDTRGATAIEYGLIIACVVIAIIVALGNFAGTAIDMWDDISVKVVTASA
ncbi:Flp family type IVb pilin [Sphingomonas sp. 1P06PA]|uniref:Flp family type IVb pilin n=1 Tax=Sphingomonas sp. 1P06PA TaxID=554121 RepID=UPI0039A59B75